MAPYVNMSAFSRRHLAILKFIISCFSSKIPTYQSNDSILTMTSYFLCIFFNVSTTGAAPPQYKICHLLNAISLNLFVESSVQSIFLFVDFDENLFA